MPASARWRWRTVRWRRRRPVQRRRPAPSPVRRATSARTARRRPTSPIPTSSPSIRSSTASRSPTAPSSGCGPARCGRKARPGTRRAAIWSGATSPTTGSCAGSRTTAASACSALPSNNSNGNTFDFQGRQLSCEHLTRRVVRYELDGSVTVLADRIEGKRLNSPNDVVPHPDGSYWFTDPPYGGQLYEGAPDAAGGPSNAGGPAQTRARPAAGDRRRQARAADQLLPHRSRAAASISSSPRSRCPIPNGLCFSPDYKRLYVVSTGKGPGDTGPGGKGDMYVFDVGSRQQALQPQAVHATSWSTASSAAPTACAATSTATSGASSNAGRAVGYSGVTVLEPGGQADRPHPPAGGLRQRLLRRAQAQPAVHGGEPVALRRVREHAGRGAGLRGLPH